MIALSRLNGFDAILDYYSDYLWGAEYWINNKQIPLYAFVFATFFSERGYLFSEEGIVCFIVLENPKEMKLACLLRETTLD